MNKLLTFALLALLAISMVKANPVEEDDVYVLTDDNFDDFIKQHEFVLTEFYAPWCGHCKKLAPEYSKAAKQLKQGEVKVPLAKIDATEQKKLAERFKVQGFPTLKFFSSGNEVEFNGGRTEKEIVSWINKRVGQVTTDLKNAEGLQSFLDKNDVALVYFGSTEDAQYGVFKSVAMGFDNLPFGNINDDSVRRSQNAGEKSVVLYKKFDEKRNDFEGELTADKLKEFIDKYSFATVMPFDDRAIEKVFQQGKPTIFLFSNDNAESVEAEKIFAEVAKAKKGDVIFSISKPNDGYGHYQRLADYIGADTSKAPQIMLVHAADDMAKYKFYGDITQGTIATFVTRYVNKELERHFKSEEIPANNNEPVKVLVGKNFKSEVIENDKDVLVEFYAPWCGHCKQLAPKYEALAKRLAHNKKIVIAKCDSTANEIPGINIKGFPTLKYFPGNKKESGPVDYDGGREEEDFFKWLKEHTTHPWVEAEKKDDL